MSLQRRYSKEPRLAARELTETEMMWIITAGYIHRDVNKNIYGQAKRLGVEGVVRGLEGI
jgi:hypothetical protein